MFLQQKSISHKKKPMAFCGRLTQHKQCMYNVKLGHVHTTIVAVEKAISITCSVCVFVDLGIQHAMHIPHYHLWPAWLYNIFPLYLIQGKIFEQKVTEHKMCVLIFSTTFVCNIFCSKN